MLSQTMEFFTVGALRFTSTTTLTPLSRSPNAAATHKEPITEMSTPAAQAQAPSHNRFEVLQDGPPGEETPMDQDQDIGGDDRDTSSETVRPSEQEFLPPARPQKQAQPATQQTSLSAHGFLVKPAPGRALSHPPAAPTFFSNGAPAFGAPTNQKQPLQAKPPSQPARTAGATSATPRKAPTTAKKRKISTEDDFNPGGDDEGGDDEAASEHDVEESLDPNHQAEDYAGEGYDQNWQENAYEENYRRMMEGGETADTSSGWNPSEKDWERSWAVQGEWSAEPNGGWGATGDPALLGTAAYRESEYLPHPPRPIKTEEPAHQPALDLNKPAQGSSTLRTGLQPPPQYSQPRNASAYGGSRPPPPSLTARGPAAPPRAPLGGGDWPFVRPPPGGFTRPAGTTEIELLRYVTGGTKAMFASIAEPKAYIVICGDGPITASSDHAIRLELILAVIRKALNSPALNPTISCAKLENPGQYSHKVAQPYCLSGLAEAHINALIKVFLWSTPAISIMIFPTVVPTPRYLCSIFDTPFLATADAEEKMTNQVREVLAKTPSFVLFCQHFRDAVPACVDPSHTLTYVLNSVRTRAIRMVEGTGETTYFRIDLHCPTNDNEEWHRVSHGLRYEPVSWEGKHALAVARQKDIHCGFCKAIDHPTTQCPLRSEGVHENTIGTSTPQAAERDNDGLGERVNPFTAVLASQSQGRDSPRPNERAPARSNAAAAPSLNRPVPRPQAYQQPQPQYQPPDHFEPQAQPAFYPRPGQQRGRGRAPRGRGFPPHQYAPPHNWQGYYGPPNHHAESSYGAPQNYQYPPFY
ncbi:hypothetical protein D9611_002104 [Ephemerocybe angulata]|uniref:Uncharacterized protein n=1 Tax=Ephemerocybe angulata TaxID=980116 RepID=A0A8H5CHX3_9AGAR|nr:hypothetical protein D9611_002104 [Tulosesus angulatus]